MLDERQSRECAILGGQLLLAIADGDAAKEHLIIREMQAQYGDVRVIEELASIAIASLHEAAGDAWHDQLNHALLDLETRDDETP
jgi:hypothetical protein